MGPRFVRLVGTVPRLVEKAAERGKAGARDDRRTGIVPRETPKCQPHREPDDDEANDFC